MRMWGVLFGHPESGLGHIAWAESSKGQVDYLGDGMLFGRDMKSLFHEESKLFVLQRLGVVQVQ